MAQHENSKDKKTVERPDAGSTGARNFEGKESTQSKGRRKETGRLSAEEVVAHIRTNPTNRMPTKGTEMASKLKAFFSKKKSK